MEILLKRPVQAGLRVACASVIALTVSVGAVSARSNALVIDCETLGTVAQASAAIRRNRTDAAAYVCRARALSHNRRTQPRALVDLGRAIKLKPDDPELFAERARLQIKRKAYKRALADFDKAILISPGAALLFERGSLRAARKDYPNAIADLDAAIKLEPDSQPMYLTRGRVLIASEQFEEAEKSFAQALAIDPTSGDARKGLGIARAKQSRYSLALTDFDSVLQSNPDDPEALYLKAFALVRHDSAVSAADSRIPEALRDVDKALTLSPNYVDALLLRTEIALTQEDYPAATRHVERAIKLGPAVARGYVLRAHIFLDNRDFRRVLADADRAQRADKALAEPHCLRASVFAELRKRARALREFGTCQTMARDRDIREWAAYEINLLTATP